MDFLQMLENIMKGKFLQRKKWADMGDYIAYFPGMPNFVKVTTQPKPQMSAWAPDVEDSNATDWLLVDPYSVSSNVGVSSQEKLEETITSDEHTH
jgi:hypothetical protein